MKRHEVAPAAKLEQRIGELEADRCDALKAGRFDLAARLHADNKALQAQQATPPHTPPWRVR
jgi:hypothetical protein